jgi:hypothetical protein
VYEKLISFLFTLNFWELKIAAGEASFLGGYTWALIHSLPALASKAS